jgi:hypothetical protein
MASHDAPCLLQWYATFYLTIVSYKWHIFIGARSKLMNITLYSSVLELTNII